MFAPAQARQLGPPPTQTRPTRRRSLPRASRLQNNDDDACITPFYSLGPGPRTARAVHVHAPERQTAKTETYWVAEPVPGYTPIMLNVSPASTKACNALWV